MASIRSASKIAVLLPFALLLAICAIRILALDDFPLIDPSEGRYAEISREMAETNDYLVPHFEAGEPFWGKPPMYFWAASLSIELFGATEFAVRLPSTIFNLLTVLVVFLLALKAGAGKSAAYLTAIILLTSGLFYSLSGLALTDTAISFFTTLALATFYLSYRAEERYIRLLCSAILPLALASAILSKGLIAFMIVLPPILSFALIQPSLRERLKCAFYIGAQLLVAIAVSVPWHIMADRRSPGFLDYYLIGEHFNRFFQPGWKSLYGTAHSEAYGMIWVFLAIGFLPWTLVLLWQAYINRRSFSKVSFLRPEFAFVLTWALALPLAFSFTRGVMFPYVLPVMPAWALLCGHLLSRLEAGPASQWRIAPVWQRMSLVVPLAFFVASHFILPIVGMKRSQEFLSDTVRFLDTDKDARIVYLGSMPYSADFYSGGRAVNEPSVSHGSILSYLRNHGQEYFVIVPQDEISLKDFVRHGKLELVYRSPKQALFREPDLKDVPVHDFIATLPWSLRFINYIYNS
ncbi:MAG: glycosyltransferase family 39 protein [Deltaproteobacteria bacterium]|nr:glycosyltransferase family 39 protein [Deltaproteobacteria bacterium]